VGTGPIRRGEIHAAQFGLGDMAPAEFRCAAHRVADLVADYLEGLEEQAVLPPLRPGEIREKIPASPPSQPESLDAILDDYRTWIEPYITHWQHPGFLAYFASVASGPGILGEWLAAGLNANVMFWQNAPAATELEERVVEWLRDLLGLPVGFDGMLNDTASVSTLVSLVAARHAVPELDARCAGLAGQPKRLRLYCSEETHTSIEKAAIVIGIGQEGVRKIAVDKEFRMRLDALDVALEEDRRAGWLPFCIVATLGTTSSTSVDPVQGIAQRCEAAGLWLHVDAAYGGAAALVPSRRGLFAGWERADSIVVNPHKWMFTPLDASLLLFRHPQVFRGAFSLVGDYMRTPDVGDAHNFNEYGIQLGRRFRALKLWMILRYFGAEGMARRIEAHCRLATRWAEQIDAEPEWEVVAPVPFATICFRFVPTDPEDPERLDAINEAILRRVNESGQIYLSGTRLRGRYVLRISIGNPRTEPRHLERCWEWLRRAAAEVAGAGAGDEAH